MRRQSSPDCQAKTKNKHKEECEKGGLAKAASLFVFQGGIMACKICGRAGHNSKTCPKAKANKESPVPQRPTKAKGQQNCIWKVDDSVYHIQVNGKAFGEAEKFVHRVFGSGSYAVVAETVEAEKLTESQRAFVFKVPFKGMVEVRKLAKLWKMRFIKQ